MKKKQLKIQIFLIITGFILIIITYFHFPYSKETKLSKNQNARQEAEININVDTDSSFDEIEYEGFYDLNKSFIVKSKKAIIFKKNPDIVHMTNMNVVLRLDDGRVVNIISKEGTFNKVTYDCFFKDKVEATDGETKIFAKNLDLLATENSIEVYNDVFVDYPTGNFEADRVKYDFLTKNLKASMFDNKEIKMKIFE